MIYEKRQERIHTHYMYDYIIFCHNFPIIIFDIRKIITGT